MKRFLKGLAIGCWVCGAASAWAFPSWMGVYGSYATHNGSNPGTYTILMNQDYYGLHAEVGIGIGGTWTTHAMTYSGNASGNSIWKYVPGVALATNTPVQYYFHGWDDWGGNIYANNYGWNYSFVAGPAILNWIGYTTHKPAAPVAGQDIKVLTQTWPKGSGQSGYILLEKDSQWGEVGLVKTTSTNQNDLWSATLGRFLPGVQLRYVAAVEDGAHTTFYDNNGGTNYSISVSTGAPLSFLGGSYHWPTNGALGPTNSLWLNLFVAPSQTLVNAFAEYSVNGWLWERALMDFWQMSGTNEWWHVELGTMPPSSQVWYAFDATAGSGTTYIRPTNGLPYSATVSGSSADSDADGLPDAWETFWFGGLTTATAGGNPDGDGLPGMPLDNGMEWVMGTDPATSNAISEIAVLWKPSIPLQGGAIQLSVASDAFAGLGLSSLTATFSDGRTATLAADGAGRFQNTVLLSTTSTVCKITSLSGGGQTDDNRGIGWTLPIQLLGAGETADTDGDGMPDAWEVQHQLDPFVDDAELDADDDDLSNLEEYGEDTDPGIADTDGDELIDGSEVNVHHSDPLLVDTDGDGMADGWEIRYGLDPLDGLDGGQDLDQDGIQNLEEFTGESDPTDLASIPSGTLYVDSATVGGGQGTYTNPYSTIQAAMDAVPSNGWVVLKAGVYQGVGNRELNFGGKPLILRGLSGSSTTVIDCGNVARAVVFDHAEGPDAVVEDVTLRDGNAGLGDGGAISIVSSSPTIRRCVIESGLAEFGQGGAIHSISGSPVVASCVLRGNIALQGAAISLVDVLGVSVINNSVVANTSTNAAILIDGASAGAIVNNTVMDNSVGTSAAIWVTGSSSPVIANNIVAFNTAGLGKTSVSTPTVSYNCIYENSVANYFGMDDLTGTDGNISEDPEVASLLYGDIRIKPTSQCRNAGNSLLASTIVSDINGASRIQDEAVDIGANESAGAAVAANPLIVRVKPTGNDLNSGNSWAAAKKSIQAAVQVSPGGTNGLEVWVAAGTYFENVVIAKEHVGLYGGFGGVSETAKEQRDVHANPTIIDGSGARKSVVHISAAGDASVLLDGLTLQHGTNDYGGGLYSAVSGGTIQNCIVANNAAEFSGGGVYFTKEGSLSNCTIRSNTARFAGGGGVWLQNGGAKISRCVIEDNTTTADDYRGDGGGGIRSCSGGDVIRNCLIRNNRATSAWGMGGGIFCSSPTNCDSLVDQCTIISNQASYANGGLRGCQVSNSIVYFNVNSAGETDNMYVASNGGDVDGCSQADYTCTTPLPPGTGNIADDPLLDVDGRLTSSSPCINAGDPSSPGEGLDLDGAARKALGRIDIGAYERSDTDGDDMPDWWEIKYFGDSTNAVASDDPDNDGLTNLQEYSLQTNPHSWDTDGDGLLDGYDTTLNSGDSRYILWAIAGIEFVDQNELRTFKGELTLGTNPKLLDTDNDGLTDGLETRWGWSDPLDSNRPPSPEAINGENGRFRVWAPNATSVSIPGAFNSWNTAANPLVSDGQGYWTGTVANASPGQAYKIYITGRSNLWRRDPRGRAFFNNQDGNSIIIDSNSFAWSDADFSPVLRSSQIVYQLHIGGFTLQTANGTQGTFQNSLSELSGRNINYVKGLGANTIALLPVAEFNTGTSWGYNPVYPFSVEQMYGSYADCKQFVNASHGLGMGVWFDVVYNHFENNFASNGKPTDSGDLWQFDGWYSDSAPGGIYYYANTSTQDWLYATGYGPRPNYKSSAVREYIRDNALMWINELHGDGLRWDFTKGIRNKDIVLDTRFNIQEGWNLMQWVNEEMRKAKPGAVGVAEDLADDPKLVTNVRANGAGFDTQWTTDGFCYPIRNALKSPTANIDVNLLSNAVNFTGATDVFSRVIYLESHDEVGQLNSKYRVVQEIANAKGLSTSHTQVKKLSSLGGTLVLTAPGIPMIFMGQEFLQDGQWSETVPLGWSKTNTFSGIVQMYRDLISLRKNVFGKTRGLLGQGRQVYGPVDNSNKVMIFRRWDQGGPGDDVVVIVNFGANSFAGNYEIGLPREGNWIERFNSDKQDYDSSFGNVGVGQTIAATANPMHGQPWRGAVSINSMSVVILSQDN